VNSDTIEQLADVLAQSEIHYRTLLGLLQQEKEAAIASNADRLTRVVEQKNEVLAQLSAQERKRRLLMGTLAGSLGIPADKLTLTRLIHTLPADISAQIQRYRDALRDLGHKIQRANAENRALVQHCLALVRNSLGFFQQILNPASVYGSQGKVNMGSGSGRLLSDTI
jgi:flagellar biosynthesis/type III secretory pathway chaperone